MSLWRRLAIEKLPEFHTPIAQADNAYGVWIDLRFALNRIYEREPVDEALIARIYEYARWCWQQSRNDDLATAVIVCFYEHLPTDPPIRKDVARWLSAEDFEALRPAFGYHLSEAEVEEFAGEFFKHKPGQARQNRKPVRRTA